MGPPYLYIAEITASWQSPFRHILREIQSQAFPFLPYSISMDIPGIPNQYIEAFTTNATRLGTRIQESFSEQARELAAAAANASSSTSSASYLDNASLGIAGGAEDRAKVVAGIKKQLESNSEREKLDALKRLVAVCRCFVCVP